MPAIRESIAEFFLKAASIVIWGLQLQTSTPAAAAVQQLQEASASARQLIFSMQVLVERSFRQHQKPLQDVVT